MENSNRIGKSQTKEECGTLIVITAINIHLLNMNVKVRHLGLSTSAPPLKDNLDYWKNIGMYIFLCKRIHIRGKIQIAQDSKLLFGLVLHPRGAGREGVK